MASAVDRGITLFELGRYEEAVKQLSENPADFTARYYLMLCFFNLKQYDRAELMTNELLAEDPNQPDIFFIKARIASQRNQDADALSFIDEAISMDPEEADYFGFKAGLLLDKKKYEEALGLANHGLSIDAKNNYCLNLRAQILTKLDRKEEAGETVENILYDNPEDSFSHANVGWVALEHGDHKKAMEHFRMALQLNPNNAYARSGMSTAIKAKNFIFRAHLKYAFWISKQQGKNQWIFIIGIYLVYRLSVELLGAAGLSVLAVPLIIAYLLFALGSWMIDPISNAILALDKNGKYLLDQNEKFSGIAIFSLVITALIAGSVFYATGIAYLAAIGLASLCAMVPLPSSFLRDGKRSRYFAMIYGSLILLVGLIGPFVVTDIGDVLIAIIFMLVAFTWLDNIVK
ncbi:tetratricopeptide repeat protein [Leeuwenhoekiella sp. H156]|uniref:tetratricopeptide repeat protein n=1 Tax=Leeuwenhoekiella sp. H156 TaxID=3450128 RepID=UPI003FA43ED1